MSRETAAELMEKASLAYADRTGLRAAINAIPWVGGSIDVVLSRRAQDIIQGRMMALIEATQEELERVKEDHISRDFLESDAFMDAVIAAFEVASRTREAEKMQYYARILRGAVTGVEVPDLHAEEALRIASELTPTQVAVGRALYERQAGGRQEGENDLQWAWRTGWKEFDEEFPEMEKAELLHALQMLQRAGLVREVTGAYYDYTGGAYVITPTFQKLMEYLGEPDS